MTIFESGEQLTAPIATAVVSELGEHRIQGKVGLEAETVLQILWLRIKGGCPDEACGLEIKINERTIPESVELGKFVTDVAVQCREDCLEPRFPATLANAIQRIADEPIEPRDEDY